MNTKGKENSNEDALSWSEHMAEAPPLEDDEYAEFYEVDELVIRFEGRVNEIQHMQHGRDSRGTSKGLGLE